jgi:ADP-ribose pyrophosphatase YjhB (NUDIX family)
MARQVSTLPRHSVSVTAVVVDDNRRVLAIRRSDDDRWVPPGGVLELHETPEQGLVREVLEETGIHVKPEALTGVYKNMNLGVVSLTFRCHVIAGAGHTTAEASEVAWLTLDQVTDLMPEARAIRVTDALRNDGPFVRVHDGTSLL